MAVVTGERITEGIMGIKVKVYLRAWCNPPPFYTDHQDSLQVYE